MLEKNGMRYCDRCGVLLTKENNKCGYELCDACDKVVEVWNGIHGQIIAPKGTFDRIYDEGEDEDDDI